MQEAAIREWVLLTAEERSNLRTDTDTISDGEKYSVLGVEMILHQC